MIAQIRNLLKQKILDVNRHFQVDLSLLICLLVVAQHSFPIKFLGLGILLVLHSRDFNRHTLRKIPWFYWTLPLLECAKFVFLYPDFSKAHTLQFAVGMVYWFAALFVCCVLYVRSNAVSSRQTERSLAFYTLLNLSVSLFQFGRICLHEHCLNPFNTGADHPYGVSSGDMITGILGGVHLTNTFICLLLVLYFVSKRRYVLTGAALLPFLLAGSNFATITLFLSLAVMLLLQYRNRQLWAAAAAIIASIILFYVLVTPVNARYMLAKFETLAGRQPVAEEQYQKGLDNDALSFLQRHNGANALSAISHEDSIFLSDPQNKEAFERLVAHKSLIKYDFSKVGGKKLSYLQTLHYLESNPLRLVFGSGMGGFSSNLAFNFSGVVDNSAMGKMFPHYETQAFREHHRGIYESMKYSHVIFHSESNKPFSVYNQLAGEYGIAGLLLFFLGYVLFFMRKISFRSFALPSLIAVLLVSNLNYFFEALNLYLFLELLLFLDCKEKNEQHS
jgi:hypothetical protein